MTNCSRNVACSTAPNGMRKIRNAHGKRAHAHPGANHPIALAGRDLVGIAQTGTGKTAAFALPILHRSRANRGEPQRQELPRARALPRRANLSARSLDSFNAYGRAPAPDLGRWRSAACRWARRSHDPGNGVDILVATPGRLLDLIDQAMRSSSARSNSSCSTRPTACSTWASSTTSARSSPSCRPSARRCSSRRPCRTTIAELAEQMLRDPATRRGDAGRLDRRAHRPARHPRRSREQAAAPGARCLKRETIDRALVFTRTKHGADKVVKQPGAAGIAADAIHGNKTQNQRERVLAAFRTGEIRDAGRDRHRRPRHRRRRHQPRGQFRSAERARDLRPPHRPHRARRRRRHRDLADRRRRGDGISARHRKADPHRIAEGRSPHARPSRGRAAAGAAPRRHDPGRAGMPRRGNEAAPGAKGPRRNRRPGGNNGAPQTNRHENSRHEPSRSQAQASGKAEGMQGVAFLHRESRPNTKPNRTQRPR